MADILVVKCHKDLPGEQLHAIHKYLKTQKETGVILLPSYLEAQLVPEGVEIKFVDKDGKEQNNDALV